MIAAEQLSIGEYAMVKVKVVAMNPDNPDCPVVVQIHDSHMANVSMNELYSPPPDPPRQRTPRPVPYDGW